MAVSNHVPVKNRILSMLSTSEYRRLEPNLERVSLCEKSVLSAPGDVVEHVYFPDNAVVSLLRQVDELRTLEVAMEGNEGAVGLLGYISGMRSVDLSVVRDPGTASRLEVRSLRQHTDRRGHLKGLLHKSVHGLTTQMAQSVVCNRFHGIDARLARWLLMTRDRLGSSAVNATQEAIAHVLAVRRSGITAAAGRLQRLRAISYRRGHIEILDRRKLRGASCPCYDIIKQEYDSFLD